jgi:phospholipase/carboxylesterase
VLRYDQYVPSDARDGAPLFVLLHGRGSYKGDLMGLQPYLPASALVVTPEAPFPAAPWGYGPGWAWYRLQERGIPEPESFRESQRALAEFLAELPARLPVRPGPVILGGFSQGGVMSLGYALMHPGAVPMVINFSGFLPVHPDAAVTPVSVRGTRIFWGHGERDPAIPYELALEGQKRLRAAGADLTACTYPMGHAISPEELADMVTWVEQGLSRAMAP